MSEKSVAYQLGSGGEFVIEQYNNAKPFASFFPGVAGMHGIPMWTFYVNRDQCIVSAPPGHSEHQLGTAVDFGSPELADVVGEPDIEFHTYFFKTSEGAWLLENAHRYGFTLSYTRETFELTGLYYEPWHYRYVGVEMATHLKELGQTLTQYQLANQPEPCIPEQP